MNTSDLLVPFTGERYAAAAGRSLSKVIAPPYDVIAATDRARFAAQHEHNIVHLILPEAPNEEGRYARAAELLTEWRRTNVLVRDPEPAVYVMAQTFTIPTGERRTRVGMFAALRAEPYSAGRVKPHERTHAGPKADRLALLRATQTNLESIFALAPDPNGALAAELGRITRQAPLPEHHAELDGVGIGLWIVKGQDAEHLTRLAGAQPLYMADGHHRYETAVAFAQEQPEADRLLAFVVSARDPGLSVLATHRIIYGAGRDVEALLDGWRRWFDVGRVAPCADRMERLAQLGAMGTACLIAATLPPSGRGDLSLVLRRDAPLDDVEALGRTPAARSLDVSRIEALVVRPILMAGTGTPTVSYTPDPREAFNAVRQGGAAAAVLLNPTRVDQVIAVADSGDVMPPKSTYFVPKVPAGIVLRGV